MVADDTYQAPGDVRYRSCRLTPIRAETAAAAIQMFIDTAKQPEDLRRIAPLQLPNSLCQRSLERPNLPSEHNGRWQENEIGDQRRH